MRICWWVVDLAVVGCVVMALAASPIESPVPAVLNSAIAAWYYKNAELLWAGVRLLFAVIAYFGLREMFVGYPSVNVGRDSLWRWLSRK